MIEPDPETTLLAPRETPMTESHPTSPRIRPPGLARRVVAWALLAWLQVVPPGTAGAAPAGENVVSGSADFQRDGQLTHITTHTPDTVVTYSSFDIGVHEVVRIDQPTAQSRILNQVLSTDPTLVEGRLFSNGQVWIVNPIGVFVGDQAIIDVGGLTAAAGNIEHGDFLAGIDRISDMQGDVHVASGAQIRAAEQVLLAGRHVANYGHIEAPGGMIALVAGDSVRLARVDGRVSIVADPVTAPDPNRFGVIQAGHVDAGSTGQVHLTAGDAYSLAMNHTGITRAGEIHAGGGDEGLVRVAGRLDASRRGAGESGGRIEVLGETIGLVGAELDASGDAGGGEILVGGEQQGQGPTRTAQRTFVDADSELRADAETEGDGGRIIVWADENTAFYGRASATGGSASGDGGFTEISGKRSLVARGDVDLSAENGEFGTLLYDPLKIVIIGGTADGSDLPNADPDRLQGDAGLDGFVASTDAGVAGAPGVVTPFEIYESEIENTNANIVLQAGQSITTTGTFDGNDVTLQDGRDLDLLVVDSGDAVLPGDIVGIDIRTSDDPGDLRFVLSQGGEATLRTESEPGRGAVIRVGTLQTDGVRAGSANSIDISAVGGADIEIGTLSTSGPASPSEATTTFEGTSVSLMDAGSVSVATDEGSIDITTIDAAGHDATGLMDGGSGGNGGRVLVVADVGSVTVQDVDASGGDGVVQLIDTESGPSENAGGGFGGTISLIADADPGGTETPTPGARSVTVTGNLTSRGGAGTGVILDEPVPDPDGGPDILRDFGASGGAGGQIFVSAGRNADEGSVTLTGGGVFDASGGDGTSAGGDATGAGLVQFLGEPLGSIRIEAHDDVDVTDTTFIADGGRSGFEGAPSGPGGLAGAGGDVNLVSDTGDIDLDATSRISANGGQGRFDSDLVMQGTTVTLAGQGGSGGSILLQANGLGGNARMLGAVEARGGSGEYGAGGAGGTLTIDTQDGAATLADVDLSGGAAGFDDLGGALTVQPLAGGNGGNVLVTTRASTEEGAAGGGNVLLLGEVTSLGGAGVTDVTPAPMEPEENGVGGLVRVESAIDVDSAGGAAEIQAGTVEITGNQIFASGANLTLASSGINDNADGPDETATVTASGRARVLLDDANPFDRVEFVQDQAGADFEVFRENGTTVVVDADGTSAQHTLRELVTEPGDAHITYRLRTEGAEGTDGVPVDAIDSQTLVVVSGGVALGDNGGKIAHARAIASEVEGERLIGAIEAGAGGGHITTAGNLELFGTRIGNTTTDLEIAGAGGTESVELGMAGSTNAVVSNVAVLDLVQRSAGADIDVDFGAGGGVSVDGTIVDNGRDRIETARVTRVDTAASATRVFFHLEDDSAAPSVGTVEPTLDIASGAVTLGADGGFASRGGIRLEDGAGPAIDAGGNQVALIADTDRDGNGAIVSDGTGLQVANASALLAVGGAGVGTLANPLRASGDPVLGVAGSGGTGDFAVENAAGDMTVGVIGLDVANRGEQETISYRGVGAGGDVALDNQGRRIVFDSIQPDETIFRDVDTPAFGIVGTEEGTELRAGFGDLRIDTSEFVVTDASLTNPHVTSGGSQRFAGPVTLDALRMFDDGTGNVDVREVRLEAGSNVTFEADVDSASAATPHDLIVESGGVASFGGDVGSNDALGALQTGAAAFTAGPHSVNVARGHFGGAILGPGDLTLRGVDAGQGTEFVFDGDVGFAGAALGSFDVDADLVTFGPQSNGIASAGDVRLNMATPTAGVPQTATIANTGGSFLIRSGGNVSVGAREKLSSAGPLGIQAAGTVRVGDLSATLLQIDAPSIVVQGRESGLVALPGGGVIGDGGVDWVANDIVTTSRPTWDGVGAAPVFALGSGGIRVPGGRLPFQTVRFSPGGDAITPDDFAGEPLRDLVGIGGRVISDPATDVPRPERPVQPTLQARFSETAPVPPPDLNDLQVLNYVRCATPEGLPCDADTVAGLDDFSGSALDTERAREIVQRYHDLIASPVGRRGLAKAFAPLSVDGPLTGDGEALYATLRSDGRFFEARSRLEDLAAVLAQISLLGLDDPNTHEVRRAVAADFAAATSVDRLDAALVLGAVDASGVGVLP